MRIRGARFLLTLPLTALGVTGLIAFVLVAHPPTEAKTWLAIAFPGVLAALLAVFETRLVVADRSTIHVVRLVGRRVIDRAHAHLSFQTHLVSSGNVSVDLMLHQAPPGTPVAITSFSSISYSRAARRARRLAQLLAESFRLSWSEDGLETREFEEALAAQSKRSVRIVLVAWIIGALVITLVTGLLGSWYFFR